jgi:hypothetical protein
LYYNVLFVILNKKFSALQKIKIRELYFPIMQLEIYFINGQPKKQTGMGINSIAYFFIVRLISADTPVVNSTEWAALKK